MFRIGEFSTIARVSDVLLRHYDDIGLFEPSYVDSRNGYRYYSIEQLPALNRILALRDLGLSLGEIGQLIRENISLFEIQDMLKSKQAQIENTIREEQSRLRRVASRLKQVQQNGTFPRHEVVAKEIPAQHFLSIREPVPYIRESRWLYFQVTDAVIQQSISGLGHCMAIFHDPYFRERNTDFELGFLLHESRPVTVPLPAGRSLTTKELGPIKQALTCIHTGPWSELHLGFGAIGAWMQANQIRINGRPREVYLNLVPAPQDDDLVVEIQIPFASV